VFTFIWWIGTTIWGFVADIASIEAVAGVATSVLGDILGLIGDTIIAYLDQSLLTLIEMSGEAFAALVGVPS
jgi:hypothetical protein